MTPSEFFRKAWRRAVATIRWERRVNAWEERRFDRKLGIDTAGRLEPMDLTVREGDSAAGITYLGTQPRLARWWLRALPPDRAAYTFIDMGSGKGRVLAFAAKAGFRRAIGVEFAEELHATAVENARALRKQGLSIEPVLGDAGAFEFPDEPLIVHFNNPFHDSVMERVIANLTRSYEASSRPIVVLYQQMIEEQPDHRTRNLELLDAVPFLTGSTLPRPRGLFDRRVVRPFIVRVWETAEVERAGEITGLRAKNA